MSIVTAWRFSAWRRERGAGLLRAVARVCALVGGVFTVAGIVDSLVYQSVKHSLGKQS